ncbi:MAG: lipoprotein insertase outer membrane protein LolB [Gammaproteobacteria bacterium]
MRLLLVLAAISVLAGCAGGPFRSAPPPAPQPADRLEAIRNWQVDGRIAIQRGDEGWSAKLRWDQRTEGFQMRLIAPLGRGTYQLAGDASRVELSVPDGRTFAATDAEALMREHLGWSLPVAGAEYWMRGLIAPGTEPAYVRRDEAGQLTDLEQSGWRVSILKRSATGGFNLPAKLFMHYGDMKVRIVVANWTLHPV